MKNIKKITIKDKNYPQSLKNIPNPPKALYVQGNILAQENCFAVVGTRMCSAYGKDITLEIAADLSAAGLTIVSGLAPGIDTFAHQAAIEKGGRTIAVLGTGLDEKSIYPQSNLKLARKILEKGGALISEYPPKTPGSKFTFPQRNRIISGLSLGILVVEAKRKSGTLITANWARKQQKLIFAVPGSIRYQNSRGCHYLIKKGAKLVENANDILKAINIPPTIPFSEKSLLTSDVNEGVGGVDEEKIKERISEEQLILNALKGEALEADKIIEKTKLSAQKVGALLSILEIKGKIRNLGGNIYALVR